MIDHLDLYLQAMRMYNQLDLDIKINDFNGFPVSGVDILTRILSYGKELQGDKAKMVKHEIQALLLQHKISKSQK